MLYKSLPERQKRKILWLYAAESNKLIDTYHVSVKIDKVQLPDEAVIDDFYTVTFLMQQTGCSDPRYWELGAADLLLRWQKQIKLMV